MATQDAKFHNIYTSTSRLQQTIKLGRAKNVQYKSMNCAQRLHVLKASILTVDVFSRSGQNADICRIGEINSQQGRTSQLMHVEFSRKRDGQV